MCGTREPTSGCSPGPSPTYCFPGEEPRRRHLRRGGGAGRASLLLTGLLCLPGALAAAPDLAPPPAVTIPRVSRAPTLEDFLEMKPNGAVEGTLAKVEGLIQREPSDGQPSTQRTEVYFGYDDKNLYVIFVCFDTEPDKIRARMSSRENVFGDDTVEVMFDTFHDQRRAYAFISNAYGIQWDAIWTEGRSGEGFDSSFDTLWYSRGRRTDQGYVVWMAIPFKSLRFSSSPQQTWGILFNRDIPRVNEETFWPWYSSRIEGRLNQAATLKGLENISPGRNIQLIPFGDFRSTRSLDNRDPANPHFVRDRAAGDAGLDAKFILKESVVVDVALNPDFSQVESDEPQVTVNQRFEVFFPEKRPFFLENASYFETPIDLLFTRRIRDPQYGVRLTGKVGPYTLGAFLIDDQSPGKLVPPTDPLVGRRALFSIVRVSRDVGKQSSLGAIFTSREFENSFNRVGGLDGRFKLTSNWAMKFQGVASSTRFLNNTSLAGPAYDFDLTRSGRQFSYELEYNDRSPGFRTLPGFLQRADIRRVGQGIGYGFRPEGKWLISWGPFFNTEAVFDHSGTRLDLTQDSGITWEFVGRSEVGVLYNWDQERLRPIDFPALPRNQDFSRHRSGLFFTSSYYRPVSVSGDYTWGTRINFLPPAGLPPVLANITTASLDLTLRPTTSLRIDNTYLFFRLRDRASGANIFNNHILRSKWNYQFTRQLSLRMILQYTTTIANASFTSLDTTKNFNADFLITYLVHPGTVLFIGYNGNAQNLDLLPTATGSELFHPRDRFINDAKQFFIKFSYLLRF